MASQRVAEELKRLRRIEYALAKGNLALFTQAVWGVLEPQTVLKWNWHHDLICEYLTAARLGQIKRLVINVAPRSTKSLLTTVSFPCHMWTTAPHTKFLFGSYGENLAAQHSMLRRTIIESKWYQGGYGKVFSLAPELNSRADFMNDKTGRMKSAGMNGSITGMGGDCFIAGTKVSTYSGYSDIETLKVGDLVWSWNHERGAQELQRIKAIRTRRVSRLVRVQSASGREVVSTPDHRIFTEGHGYRQAKDLLGEKLVIQDEVLSDSVSMVEYLRQGEVNVYDIQVEGNSNFFANQILVHNCIIIDDPHNPQGAESQAERETTIENFDLAWSSRLNDKKTGRIIVIMQRLHERDLTGHLLAKNADYVHIKIPTIAEERETIVFPMSGRTLVRESGEYMHPERDGPKEIAQAKIDLGPYGFSGQHQQNPTPKTGGIFTEEMFDFEPPPNDLDYSFITCDTAYTDKQENDFTVLASWGIRKGQFYLLDVFRKQIKASESEVPAEAFIRKHLGYGFRGAWIEPKGHGIYLYQTFRRKGLNVPNESQMKLFYKNRAHDKVTRANNAAPWMTSRKLHINPAISMKEELLSEVLRFPKATHDDFLDCFVDAILIAFARSNSILDVL